MKFFPSSIVRGIFYKLAVYVLQILNDRIDVNEGVDINETSSSKEYIFSIFLVNF